MWILCTGRLKTKIKRTKHAKKKEKQQNVFCFVFFPYFYLTKDEATAIPADKQQNVLKRINSN